MINSRIPTNLLISRITTEMVDRQQDLALTQEQISSGKKVNRPSDEPAQAARLVSMREATRQLDQFQRNADTAEAQLNMEEGALSAVSDSLNRIRELVLVSNNGIVTNETRDALQSEIQLRLEEIYDSANSRDSYGNFLFGGTNTHSSPFGGGVPVVYSGSDDSNELKIGMTRKIQSGDTGIDVFMRIRNGNGTFSTHADSTNTGTGIITQGAVEDSSVYDSRPYRIDFTSATSFDIIDDTSNAVLQTGNAYTSGEDIVFNGFKVGISGGPEAGDRFTVMPSQNQDVFSTVSNFINALDNPVNTSSDSARMQQNVNEALQNLDSALIHVNTYRSRVGTRLNSIDTSKQENQNIKLELQRTQASIEDIDIAEAVTNLQTQANALEILQKSFVRIEGMNLFNYLQ